MPPLLYVDCIDDGVLLLGGGVFRLMVSRIIDCEGILRIVLSEFESYKILRYLTIELAAMCGGRGVKFPPHQ